MSRIGSKLSRRIMAAALSVAMIMSNMTVYATQISDEPVSTEEVILDEDMEIVDEDAEIAEDVEVVNEDASDAEVVDELTYEEESAEALYSVEDAEISENEGGDIEATALVTGSEYDFGTKNGTALNSVNDAFADNENNKPDFDFGSDNFKDPIDNSHGLFTLKGDATLTFTTPGTESDIVDVNVLLCCYMAGASGAVTCDESGVAVAKQMVNEGKDVQWNAPKYTVLGLKGNTSVTLKFTNNTYIHHIQPVVRASGVTYNTITVNNANNGKVYASAGYAAKDAAVTLTAVPDSGYGVKSWGVMNGSEEVTVTPAEDGLSATFAMPEGAVTVTPEFESKGSSYSIGVTEETIANGTVTASKTGDEAKVVEGAEVVVGDYASFTANEGYHFKKWIVKKDTEDVTVTKAKTGANVGKYVFTMPAGDVTISAEFEEDSTVLRTSWDFTDKDDDTIYGVDNTVDYSIANGSTGTIAGLTIVAAGQYGFFTKGKIQESGNGAVASSGTVIKVPVASACSVSVTWKTGGTDYTIGVGTDTEEISGKTGTYTYTGTDAATVDITVGTPTNNSYDYLQAIEVEPVTTYTITVNTSVDNATVTAGTVTSAPAGTVVALKDVATVAITDADNYELSDWTVKTGEGDSATDVTVGRNDAGEYVFTMPAGNVTVTPVITEKGTTLKTYWDFNTDAFKNAEDIVANGYDGLVFTTGAGRNTGGDGTIYLTLIKDGGATVQIPIDKTKDWAVKVGYSYAANAKFEAEETPSIYIDGTGGSGTAVYYYEANSALINDGYVTVTGLENADPTYITKIEVVAANKASISVTTSVEHATVSTTGKLTSAFAGQTVKLSDVAEVTIAEADADTYELSGWKVTYGQTGSETNVTVNKGADGYSFIMPGENVTVTPLVTEKAVQDPYPTWDFSSADFQNDTYAYPMATDLEYKGLLITRGMGAHNKNYLYGSNGHSISIPVSGPCTITVTTQHGQSYYFEAEGLDGLQTNGTSTASEYSYDYESEDAGYVVIKTTATTYFTKIQVSQLAQKYDVEVVTNVENATVTPVADAPNKFSPNRIVKISDLATVEPANGFELGGWEVKQTESGEAVDVTYDETNGYMFTMPAAAVTVKPIISAVSAERTVTVVPKAGTETLTAEALEGTVILFEDTVNLTNKVTVTVGTGAGATALDAVKLKDGTYKVSVYNSKLYALQPIDDFTVSADSLTCTINFDKNPKSWDFRDASFQDYYKTGSSWQWYNGLEITNVLVNNADYAKLAGGSKIKIPVPGECNVTIVYYGGEQWLGATLGNKPYVGGSGNVSLTYHYPNDEAGIVEISATGQASVQTITITDPVAAPVFSPKDADETKSEYTFTTNAGDVVITSADGAEVKYVVSTDYEAAAFEAITEDKILEQGDKLKDTQPIRVSSSNTIIKAVAVKDGNITSKLVSYTYNVTADGADPVDVPTVTPAGGTVEVGQKVTLEAVEGADIYYTLNGMTPTTSSQKYDKETPISLDTEGDITIKAIAVKGDVTSTMVSFTYKVVKVTKLNRVDISGSVRPGSTLTARANFTGTPGSNTTTVYEWYKVTEDAEGNQTAVKQNVSGDTFKIPDTEFVGAKIRVKVIFTDELGAVSSAENTTKAIEESLITGVGLEIEFEDGTEYTYNGTPIKPAIIVTNNNVELTEGTDYTVKYTNNTKAGKASGDAYDKKAPGVTVTGKGNLSGKISANFTINPRALTDEDVVAGDIVVTDGAKASLVILYNGAKLTAKDYEVTAPTDFKSKKWTEADAGEDKVTIKGKGNFSDKDEDALTLDVKVISKDEAKNAKITANFADTQAVKKLTYTGAEIKPEMAVSNKAKATDLVEGTDYLVSYPDDTINVGTKKVTIVGISAKCTGSVTKSYKIQPASKNGSLEVDGVYESYPYVSTGVTFGDEAVVDYVWTDESGVEQSTRLTNGVDYKFVYSGNKKAGTAKYSVTGLGNYKGLKTAKQDFTITGLALVNSDDNKVIVSDKIFNKKGAYKSVPIVIMNGTLVKSSEYKVEYQVEGEDAWAAKPSVIESLGDDGKVTINVRITAKKATGNYGAAVDDGQELTGSYDVVSGENKVDFSKAKITFQTKDGSKAAKVGFTGNEVTPYKAVIKCKGAQDIEIVLDKDSDEFATKGYTAMGFDVTYANNVAKGKATVAISAKSDNETYVGSKSATFSIVQKNLQKDLGDGEGFIKATAVADLFKSIFK